MTQAFGRARSSRSRSSFRAQRRGGSTSIRRSQQQRKTTSKKRSICKSNCCRSRSRSGCTVPLKTGRGKSQGSDSGSSKESRPPLSPSKPNSQFYPSCPKRRRNPAESPPSFQLSVFPARPTNPAPAPAFLWRNPAVAAARTAASSKETQLHFFFFNFGGTEHRTCKIKNGGFSPPPSNDVVSPGDKAAVLGRRSGQHRHRGGGTRQPHCPGDGPERQAQQGLHGERPEGPPRPARRSHRHSILRRPGPARLRPTQQGRRLANQEGQGRHRRARRASLMEPTFDFNHRVGFGHGDPQSDHDRHPLLRGSGRNWVC